MNIGYVFLDEEEGVYHYGVCCDGLDIVCVCGRSKKGMVRKRFRFFDEGDCELGLCKDCEDVRLVESLLS